MAFERKIAGPWFWSAADDETLRAGRRAGKSFSMIARSVGRTRNAVAGRLKRLRDSEAA